MPVIRRGDRDGVDVLVLEQLADVLISFDLVPFGRHLVLALGEDFRVDIAERGEPHALQAVVAADVRSAAAIEADDSDADITIRAGGIGASFGGKPDGGGGEGGFLEE